MNAQRICIIGAGPSGLTAAKNLADEGFTDVVIYDLGHQVGGNWVFDADSGHSSVFETTHIISSKRFSQYEDFPMPEEYPDYPSHSQLAEYFQNYADAFDLHQYVRSRHLVEHCERRADGGWEVTVRNLRLDADDESARRTEVFDQLVVCNGHHWKPRWPDYPGEFTGRYIHSHDYKRAAPFDDERVLVIGGGNSACDCAVETSRVSTRTDISWRRGYWVVPKFLFGLPADLLNYYMQEYLGFVPLEWRFKAVEGLLTLLHGPNSWYDLPEPDHDFGETHPLVNSELLYFIRHGEVQPRPDVERYDGRTVHFEDGSSAEYDSVIACTGFEIAHPFFDDDIIDYSEGPVPLYLKMIHPQWDNLHFVGLIQPLGCIWPLAELQAKIMARRLAGKWEAPEDLDAAIAEELENPHVEQLDTPRHTITVDFLTFRDRLLEELPDPAERISRAAAPHPPRSAAAR